MTGAKPGVLMVTGAYYPEISGAGLQCRALVNHLRDRVDFTVLTTTADRALPVEGTLDGIPVYRVYVQPSAVVATAVGAFRMTGRFLRASRRSSIVHFHGFSRKSILLIWLALAAGKKIAIKMTSLGDDDPVAMRTRGLIPYWTYRRAHIYFAINAGFLERAAAAGLPQARCRLIPNGVDLVRFRPPEGGERAALRLELGLPADGAVVLFVGFFSREKRPDLLFEAWSRAASASLSTLVYIGATRSSYHEVDPSIAERIRHEVGERGWHARVLFIEAARDIERFYRVADVFVLPSVREGLPNALLEAMASGAACIASRIPGVTDRVIDDGRNGVLVPADDVDALARALRDLLADPAKRARLAQAARATVERHYNLEQTAHEYLQTYLQLLAPMLCVA